jgi:hypothetical protein
MDGLALRDLRYQPVGRGSIMLTLSPAEFV